jgi:CheY-like chemotaxis protein
MRQPIHLLLVEDNPGDALLVRGSLRQCPGGVVVDVTIAEDGAIALALLNGGFKPDLTILDLNIPRIDGYTVLERLELKTMPVVVFTSASTGTDRALMLGAREVVQKPTDFPAFVETVCGIIDRWSPKSDSTERCLEVKAVVQRWVDNHSHLKASCDVQESPLGADIEVLFHRSDGLRKLRLIGQQFASNLTPDVEKRILDWLGYNLTAIKPSVLPN